MNKTLSCPRFILACVFFSIFIASCSQIEKGAAIPELNAARRLISEENLDEARQKLNEIAQKNPDSAAVGEIYYELARSYEGDNGHVRARDLYQLILDNYQNIDNILDVQKRLGRLNADILFSPVVTERDVLYEVEPGDTLAKIAKKFGTTVELIKKSNSLESDLIQIGSDLKVSRAEYKILIDKSQNLLTVFFDDGDMFKTYRVSTGENNSTPEGTFRIVNRIKDPVWYSQGVALPSESPDNILGSRWLGLSVEGYGIHGTIDPDSVGRQATRGCIRMLNEDVEELYTIIPPGTEVTIVN